MLTRNLILFLLLGVLGCSTQNLTQASEPVKSAESTAKIITAEAATSSAEALSGREVSLREGEMKFSLDSYQWKNRLLLVFAPSENSPAYQKQMQLFEGQKAGFEDRDLLMVQLMAEGESSLNSQLIDGAAAAQLRSQFDVNSEEFRVILVGKDGTAKRRDTTPVAPMAIFKEIDAMPMRRQEMRSSQQ